ncbi:MAG: DUF6843 domain-containing protein [Saprospiraceae bacterium]
MKIYQKVLQVITLHSLSKANTWVISLSVIMLFAVSCSQNYNPEMFYVPDGYVGWVFVIYNQKHASKKQNNGYRIYEIPKNGILFTKFETNWGVIQSNENDIQFYFIDSTNQTVKKLPVYIHPNEYFLNRFKDSLVAFPMSPHGTGKYSIYPIYIDSLKNIDKYDLGFIPIEEYQIDSIIEGLGPGHRHE